MIKLIATDLDGTLINSNRTIPDDFEEVWNILDEKGIVFLAATGRDYHGAAGFFGDFAEKKCAHLHRDWVHYNDEGSGVLAGEIVAFLEQEGLI